MVRLRRARPLKTRSPVWRQLLIDPQWLTRLGVKPSYMVMLGRKLWTALSRKESILSVTMLGMELWSRTLVTGMLQPL